MALKIFIASLVSLIVGFLVGLHLQYDWDSIILSDTKMTMTDYYQLLISIIEAIGTCAAVIVALFLNEIRACFKKVSFDVVLSNTNAVEDVEDIKKTKKALRYYNHIQFLNKGNINAQNCELYLESANFFINENNINPDSFPVLNEPINWGNSTMVYIPSQGKKILRIFEITAPQKQSNPSGKDDYEVPAKYTFLGLSKPVDAKKGKWELTYCLNSTTSKPHRFKLEISWDGQWEERESEMKKLLTMNLNKL